MRRLVVLLLLWPAVASAQLAEEPKVTVTLTVEQAMLVVQTLGAISCQTVQAMVTCNRALETLRGIQRQVKEQQK